MRAELPWRRVVVSLAMLLLGAGEALSTVPELAVTVADRPVTVGDRVPVRVVARGDTEWLWGELRVRTADGGAWELVDGPRGVSESRPPSWELTLVPLRLGELPLPEIEAPVRTQDGGSHLAKPSSPSIVMVESVLPPEAEAEPVPMRDPVGVSGVPWEWILPAAVGLVPVAVMVWWLMRHRRRGRESSAARLSPSEELERLVAELRSRIGVEPTALFCDRLAAGLRHYLERRSGEPAAEMTSFELRLLARHSGWPEELQRALRSVTGVVDGVRFGRRGVSDQLLLAELEHAVVVARSLEAHLKPRDDDTGDDLEAA